MSSDKFPEVPGVIRAGDDILIEGDPAFLEALVSALGPRWAAGRAVGDMDQRLETYLTEAHEDGGRLRYHIPRQRLEPPALALYASDKAHLRDRLEGAASVTLKAISPTLARVIRVDGQTPPRPVSLQISGRTIKLVTD